MVNIYKTKDDSDKLIQIKKIEKNCWIDMINPTEKEIKMVAKKVNIDEDSIRYALDDEERSRIDVEDTQTMILVDVPTTETTNDNKLFNTMPLGIVVARDECIITVCLKKVSIFDDFIQSKVKSFVTNKKTRFTLQLLFKIASQYLKYLKMINKETDRVEKYLHKSTQNKDLFKLLNIEKSLVYLNTSLKSNQSVLERLSSGKVLTMYEEDEDILEETIIENKQAIEMAQIYSAILSSMTEAFGTIISNNLNNVMKFLAGITIVCSIPTMIASFMGMNVNLGVASNNPYVFPIILVIAMTASLLVAIVLRKKDML